MAGLEERAKTLAALFTPAPASRRREHDVRPRLDENLRVLAEAYRLLADDVHRGVAVAPAAEWLLDNYHLVESEARAVRRDLPARYYRTLPTVAAREFAGEARIHALALELIRHGDGRLDAERLARFVLAFQTVAPLTIGELWALPSLLKLALLENLRLLADGILAGRAARLEADGALARLEMGDPPGALPDPLPDAFVAQLRQRMHEYDPRASPLAAAVELALAASGTTPEDAVRSENQRQATDQVSTGNTVTSLRFCATLDWSRLVERVSSDGGDPAAGPGRGLPADGLRQPRPLPARRGGSRPADRRGAGAGGPAHRRERAPGRAAGGDRRAGGARRPSPDRSGPPRPRDRRGIPPSSRPATPPLGLRPRHGGVPRRHRPADRSRRPRRLRLRERLGDRGRP